MDPIGIRFLAKKENAPQIGVRSFFDYKPVNLLDVLALD
jgi:hypothetical protein